MFYGIVGYIALFPSKKKISSTKSWNITLERASVLNEIGNKTSSEQLFLLVLTFLYLDFWLDLHNLQVPSHWSRVNAVALVP